MWSSILILHKSDIHSFVSQHKLTKSVGEVSELPPVGLHVTVTVQSLIKHYIENMKELEYNFLSGEDFYFDSFFLNNVNESQSCFFTHLWPAILKLWRMTKHLEGTVRTKCE